MQGSFKLVFGALRNLLHLPRDVPGEQCSESFRVGGSRQKVSPGPTQIPGTAFSVSRPPNRRTLSQKATESCASAVTLEPSGFSVGEPLTYDSCAGAVGGSGLAQPRLGVSWFGLCAGAVGAVWQLSAPPRELQSVSAGDGRGAGAVWSQRPRLPGACTTGGWRGTVPTGRGGGPELWRQHGGEGWIRGLGAGRR